MTIHRFAETAARFNARPAVLAGGTRLSYADLAAAAGGRARAIGAPGARVGLLTTHGVETITGILGTLAAGCAYVPLDPSFPLERLSYMVNAAGVSVVLANRRHADLAHELVDRVVFADDLPPAPLEPADAGLDDVAYVLFTSGSTGRPKAVAQTHRNLLHVVDNQIESLGITAADRLSLLASFSFDAAIPDLYPALLTGASVVPVDVRANGLAHTASALARHGVTIYHSTPTVYRYLLDALDGSRLGTVRTVLLGGEQSTYADVRKGRERFAPGCVFVNGYGATEVTFAAQHQLSDVDGEGPLPIGTALPGYELVLGAGDEITVRGRHLIDGYANQDSDAFTVDEDGVRQYRTGDLGRLLPDGRMVCLGRLDRQVNVRGFRVELTEVEAALLAQPGVTGARVIVRAEELLGYVVGAADGQALRAALAETLPDYALPRAVVVLDEFPLTVTGKLDELALPAPARSTGAGRALTEAERRVHDIWCAVLRTDAVAPDDTFFDVGGHSLLLGQVQQRLAAEFDTEVPLLRLFEHPTVATQAAYLAGDRPKPERRHRPPAEYSGEEIAVVGMAGRFPGAADIDAFWWNLCAGVDAIHDYTDEELAELGIGPGLRGDPRHVRAGGRLDGIEDFDAGFFSFGADEAARTDPQHRLFLETAWEAMENAGHTPGDGEVGVFAATSANRYFLFHLFDNPEVTDADPDDWEARLLDRQFPDHLPGQVAYRLGLTGPALAVQTACSSSLAAVALAAQSLADYRCDLALAGGVSVIWPRHRAGGMVSPDGRCRAFDEAARGSGFSSGVGVVVLRRLADAIEDRDHIHAVLPGWGMTNDGADRGGYAVPGMGGQAAAIAAALATAEIQPDEVRFVEAHGSGTPLGDAIEVAELNEVFAGAVPESCALGSVKTSIGHLDAAAGVAGLIKAVLAVRDGIIPPNLHFSRPHPEVDLAGGPFYVPTKVRDWPEVDRRVAGVSSFGMGGTNVHVLVAEPPASEPSEDGGEHVLPISARDETALRQLAGRLRDHLAAQRPALADVAYTLATGRRVFDCGAAVVASTVEEAVRALDELAGGGPLGAVGGANTQAGGRRIPLPTYPFQRSRFWIEATNRGGQGELVRVPTATT
jgi:phthiocerol/phenolphthiocerol synthesis type-I polyketide synthase E